MGNCPEAAAALNKIREFGGNPDAPPLLLSISWTHEEARPLASLVTVAERRRAASFLHEHAGLEFIASRAVLRQLLPHAASSREVIVQVSKTGKPYIQSGPSFNLSHSGSKILIGFCHRGEVGVDVELVRPFPELSEVAKESLTDDEIAAITVADEWSRCRQFFSIWVRKEAVTKAIGLGLSMPFSSFSFDSAGLPVPRTEQANVLKSYIWTVRSVNLDNAYCAAIAVTTQTTVWTFLEVTLSAISQSASQP